MKNNNIFYNFYLSNCNKCGYIKLNKVDTRGNYIYAQKMQYELLLKNNDDIYDFEYYYNKIFVRGRSYSYYKIIYDTNDII